MKRYNKYQEKGLLLLGAMLLGGFYSCDDSFLEKKPLDAVSEADVWVDVPLVEAYVNQTYATLRAGYWANSRWDISSDDGYGTEKGDAHLIQRGEVTPSNLGYLEDPWEEHYATITNCNKFLEKMTGATLDILKAQDEAAVNRMIGEMQFLRAYSYFRLIAFYGGVPLITTPFKLGDDYLVERSSYDEVLDFVVSELDAAAELLPPSYSGADLGRVTQGAAMAIKSRALLYAASPLHNPANDKAKWQAAADAAKAVIDLERYSLYPDYKESFTEAGNFNEERIWEHVLNQDLLYSGEYRIERKMFPNGSAGWGHPSPTQNLVDCYEMTSGLLPHDDPGYDPQNPYVNRDPRFYASILYNGAPWQGRSIEVFRPGGRDSPDGPEGWNA
ncbi:MAG TPA: RagB/SusD family nutrient uptake outer membrane protein, partial [Anseongella sp.]|nr:RagB/SusD family nutrient uptake outer membrane protein [Anseongella sp.]